MINIRIESWIVTYYEQKRRKQEEILRKNNSSIISLFNGTSLAVEKAKETAIELKEIFHSVNVYNICS